MASTKRELRNLSTNTQATAAELKAFLAEFKGRSPQEMLGIVAASRLFRALILSTILVIVGILVFTVIPYFMSDSAEEPVVQEETPVEAKPAPQPAPKVGEETKPDKPVEGDLSPLGVGEEKQAPPDVNPLENKGDDFLDGLE